MQPAIDLERDANTRLIDCNARMQKAASVQPLRHMLSCSQHRNGLAESLEASADSVVENELTVHHIRLPLLETEVSYLPFGCRSH